MVLANDPVKVITINVLGSLNLLYAAMDAGVADVHLLLVGCGVGQFL